MSTSLSLTQLFPVPPSDVFAMLGDRQRITECARAANGPDAAVRTHEHSEDGLIIVTESPVATASIPAGLRPLLANGAVGTKTEIWTATEDGYRGTFEIAVPGAPANLSGTATLTVDAGGSRLSVDGTAHVKIPVLGAKIEKLMVDQATERLTAEYRFLHDQVA
jgi:hypothetical protein